MSRVYAEHAPGERLRPFVECYWTMSSPARASLAPVRVLPDGCMDIIFDLSAAEGVVIGTMTRAIVTDPTPGASIFGVRFRPGAAPAFLDAPARGAADESIPLDALWGSFARELAERVASARSTAARLALLDLELLGRLEDAASLATPGRHAVALVVSAQGEIRIDDLADRVGLGERKLERVFHELVGVSPKVFARIVRFRALVDALRTDRAPRWAELAARLGYYDQAHLIREVRAFSGLTPGELARERAADADR
jgi:AraC-like DNA-binding protein